MAYPGQTWVDGVTPLDAAHMNALDVGVVGAVDVDNVAAAASQIVANKLLAADAQPAFKILGDGTHQWGPGGSTVYDTNLYRSAAGSLKTDGSFWVGSSIVLDLANSGGANKLYWGSAADTNLYRSAAGNLKTDGQFAAGTYLTAHVGAANQMLIGYSGGVAAPGITFSNAGDTNLYRSAAGNLKTDGQFAAGTDIYARVGAAEQIKIGSIGTGKPIIVFGTAGDNAAIYRSAADTLQTDGKLVSAWSSAVAGAAFQASNMYLFGVAFSERVGGDTVDRFTINATGNLNWGPGNAALDTNLYRGSAGELKTDSQFTAGGTITALGLLNVAYPNFNYGGLQVTLGAADSGGSGFRMLRVSN